jgi:hypothetical protein
MAVSARLIAQRTRAAAFVLGWLVAGRMLRPLRTIDTAIKRSPR